MGNINRRCDDRVGNEAGGSVPEKAAAGDHE